MQNAEFWYRQPRVWRPIEGEEVVQTMLICIGCSRDLGLIKGWDVAIRGRLTRACAQRSPGPSPGVCRVVLRP